MSVEREQKGRIYDLEKENRRLLEENLKLIMMATHYQREAANEAKTLPAGFDR